MQTKLGIQNNNQDNLDLNDIDPHLDEDPSEDGYSIVNMKPFKLLKEVGSDGLPVVNFEDPNGTQKHNKASRTLSKASNIKSNANKNLTQQ